MTYRLYSYNTTVQSASGNTPAWGQGASYGPTMHRGEFGANKFLLGKIRPFAGFFRTYIRNIVRSPAPKKQRSDQMRFTKNFKYNIKRALPLLAIAGAGFMSSCDKEDEPTPVQHDVELPFTKSTADDRLTFSILQGYINDPTVRNIYLVVEGDWNNYTPDNISQTRDNFLEPRIKMSPKIRGRGDFHFTPGAASRVPSDSLWYIQQGWTINKYLQKQK